MEEARKRGVKRRGAGRDKGVVEPRHGWSSCASQLHVQGCIQNFFMGGGGGGGGEDTH